jgi:RNA polymerase sigma-70 factor (ECF subfamily)
MTSAQPASPHLTAELPALARGSAAAPTEFEQEIVGLFDELRNRLLRYALSFGLSVADGEEIIQDAFLSLVQHLRQRRSRQNLRGWLFRVVHNQALKRLVRHERGRRVIDSGVGETEVHPDPNPNPEEQVAFSQQQARLLAALQALPARDRQCLSLRAEGLRYREIAEILGISLGSVCTSLARSLARLGRVSER